MDPPPPKQKLSVRKTLRKAVSVFRRSPSPSGSQKPSGEPSTKSRSPSPLPSNESHRPGPSSHDLQTPALVTSTPTPTPLNDEPPTIVITPVHTIPPDTAGEQPSSEANSAWAGLGTALRSLQKSVGAVPPLQSAVGSFLSCLDILEEAAANRKDYDELASELVSLSQILAQHMSQSSSKQMSKSIINITRLIEEQGNFINSKRSRGKGARIMESSEDRQDIDRSYRRIGSLFRQLQADVQLSIWSIMNTQMANTRLKELDPVKLANYDSNVSTNISRRSCTANTRTMVLHELDDWSYSPDAADVYWMNGMAGTGKTTIAYSFSELLEKRKQLAASFFCTRSIPQCQDVSRIIPTIAYQLARYSLPFQSALCEVLAEDPDASSKNMSRQFEQLLKTPLAKVQEAMPNNLVVVIDALDECGDVCSVEQFLMILLKSATDVPLRFFITSRPEPEIHSRMRTRGADTGDTLLLHEVEKSLVQADIETYLEEELKFMSPTPAEINELVRRSGNLFIYAATIVRSIITRRSQIDPHRRLRAMLSGSQDSTKQYASIDQLYATILGDALEKHSDYMQVEEIEEVHRVLRTALCVREPVHITTLAILAGLTDEGHAMDALQPLRAVINLTESTRLVSTLHVSFLDFMFDKTRSKAFYCDPGEQNIFLAQRCFEVMKAQLRFNICSLESSFVPDSAVAELKDRAKERISSELIYTCQYWADHLRQAVYSEPLGVVLEDFIRTRLLFWMEVLNLKELISLGGGILLQAILWLLTGATPAGLQTLVEDAQNIVMGFAVGPMSQCTPHIYLSLFSFCPRSNSVYENYRGKIQGSLNPEGTLIQKRNDDALSSWNIGAPIYSVAYSLDSSMLAFVYYPSFVCIRSVHDGKLVSGPFTGHKFLVNAVAYSPDGTRIASGSDDKTIRIWGVYNDAAAAGPFVGHTGAVLTVVYSPDSTHIASGSADETIRVWRVDSGLLVTEPFEGHTNMVHSIAYSPDGTRIVSGSSDRTVRVWNARDGTLVVGPFEGHSGMVTSIACSPDGTQIASGSADQTIRLWNSESGTLVAGPMEGHEALISSVAYSPNSTRLVSGAHDRMLRVWSAQTGKPVAGPLQGHTEAVMVVAYSPDGTRIVSGSDDRTIRFWGAYNSTYDPIPPPEGHSESVESVAYSPDATCIISSSHDKTIRVWSAHSGELVAGPLRGHTGPIDSVTYSPDGEHIASGSWDNTVRVWSSHDGKAVLDPLQGHTGAVYSVVYSPDGTRIVSGSMDCTIRVWNAHSGELILGPLQGHTDQISSVAHSPSGTQIASGSYDSTIRLWNSSTGLPIISPLEGHTKPVTSVAYSPDSAHIVSGSWDRTVRVWDMQSGALVAGPFNGHEATVSSVAYSPDGTRIISGSLDSTIRLWNAQDGTLIADPFQTHGDFIQSVAFSPDGSSFVSSSSKPAIRVWDLTKIGAHVTTDDAHDPASAESPPSNEAPDPTSTPTAPASALVQSSSTSNLQSLLRLWKIQSDGWVVNNDKLLFWVPPDIASYLPTIYNPFVIAPFGTLRIDYDNLLLGKDWHNCYQL